MSSKRFSYAIAISLFLHGLIFLIFNLKSSEEKTEDPIEITFLDEKPSTSVKKEQLQIVEQSERQLNEEVPEESKFLGRKNQRVLKQTKAAEQGQFKNTVGGGSAANKKKKKVAKNKKKKNIKSKKGNMPTLADLKPKFDWDEASSKGMKGTQLGVAKTADYLKDVDTGAQTLLSTREFVYYSYYNRIKKKLQYLWEPKIKEKMQKIFRSGRKIASAPIDRTTQLVIILNAKGILTGVKVLGESGITELDDAAIEAFRAAAPFPNPPKGIIEKDGTVKIRWDFVLEA